MKLIIYTCICFFVDCVYLNKEYFNHTNIWLKNMCCLNTVVWPVIHSTNSCHCDRQLDIVSSI
jgi:hypothetical protein